MPWLGAIARRNISPWARSASLRATSTSKAWRWPDFVTIVRGSIVCAPAPEAAKAKKTSRNARTRVAMLVRMRQRRLGEPDLGRHQPLRAVAVAHEDPLPGLQ